MDGSLKILFDNGKKLEKKMEYKYNRNNKYKSIGEKKENWAHNSHYILIIFKKLFSWILYKVFSKKI